MRTIGSRRPNASSGRFVGRIAEQQLFRATLRELAALRDTPDEQLPDDSSYAQIFLVAAEGGMGKSTLLRRFAELVADNADGARARPILLDLERSGTVADADAFLRLLHNALAAAGFEEELEPYRDALARRADARRKAADAEEQLRSRALGLGERPRQPTEQELRAFVASRLDTEELRLANDPEATTDYFMEALNRIATPARPLVLLIDTYELADRCDRWVRERLLPLSGTRLVWVIAGREGQPFVRRYENEFGASLTRGILLDTFARPDIVAYVRQCGVADPGDELIERLQALSRGVPLALEGWFNLFQKHVDLPPPDPAAPTTRRAIVQRLTDRFLRYCNDDDLHLSSDERQRRTTTRNHILTLMLLHHTDVSALAAAWQRDVAEAEATLEELDDQFSFVFAQEIERQPHALVKEILREWLRGQSALPALLQAYAEQLATHFERRMRERELTLWGIEPTQMLSAEERAALERQREQHRRTFNRLEEQIAGYTELDAPVSMLNQRDDARAAIDRIDARLSTGSERATAGPRRPLWNDDSWREALLSRVNALCWAERSGERAMCLLVPMWVEALEFHESSAGELLEVAREFAEGWPRERGRLVEDGETLATLDALMVASSSWRLASFHRQIVHVRRGVLLLKDTSLETGEQRSRALQAADEAARLLPKDGSEVVVSVGRLYSAVGRRFLWQAQNKASESPEAERALNAAVQYTPKNQTAWYNLGVALYMLKQHTAAVMAYKQAIDLDPKDAYSYNGLGNVYRAMEQYEDALDAYQQAIALDPKLLHPLSNLGNVFHTLGRHEDALTAYQQAAALDPKNVSVYNCLGAVYRTLRQYRDALSAYQQALSLDANNAVVYNGLGNIYRDLEQYKDAEDAYQQAIAFDRNNSLPHNGLGNLYSLLGRKEIAKEAYQRAVDIDPKKYSALAGIARLERQAGDSAEAMRWVERARSLLPKHNLYELACLESIAGNVEAALEALRVALEHKEVPLEWARQDPDFDFIRDDPRFQALVGGGEGEKPR